MEDLEVEFFSSRLAWSIRLVLLTRSPHAGTELL